MDNSVYYKVPTVIWYEIFEYLDYSMIHRKRCFFITKKGTVCKNKRIYGDCGEEIWCLTHGHKFLNKINKKDINVIKIIKEMIGEKRCNYIKPKKKYITTELYFYWG